VTVPAFENLDTEVEQLLVQVAALLVPLFFGVGVPMFADDDATGQTLLQALVEAGRGCIRQEP
jgi:hypothetical protein